MHSQESGEPLVDLLAHYARVNADRTLLKDAGVSLPRVTDATKRDADVLAASGRPHDVLRRTTHDEGRGYGAARTELKRHRLLDTTSVRAYGSVLEELALVGVVATAGHPGLMRRWSDYVERDQRPNDRVGVQGPLAWWRSSDGLREDVVREVFTDFEVEPVDLDAPRPAPDPLAGATIVAGVGGASPKECPARRPRGRVPSSGPLSRRRAAFPPCRARSARTSGSDRSAPGAPLAG
ncbi:hypothetical protein ABZU76_19080 [Amycolatopsis sp. NPDC005232]|uniref:hypothetical protein n=1 Tax=Amycolatopsis sp. NPDC005232 TaxID=3157027 RepID=UPI0033BCA18C